MSIKRIWKKFVAWLKAEIVTEVPGDIDIDGNLPDYVGTIEGGEADADEVPFANLRWTCGGFDGSYSVRADAVTISLTDVDKNGLRYHFDDGDLRAISPGNSHENPDCVACLFVQTSPDTWHGGKFDWISSDRLSRDFKNIRDGYHGWSPSAIGGGDSVCFVIVSADGKSRTNVSRMEVR